MRLWRPSRKSFLVVRFDRQRTSSHLFYQLSSERLIRRLYIWIWRRHLLFHISCCFIGFHFLIFLSKFPPLFLLGLFFGFLVCLYDLFGIPMTFRLHLLLAGAVHMFNTSSIARPHNIWIIHSIIVSTYNVLGSSSLMSIILQSILPWRSSSNQTNVCKCYVSE